MAFTEDDSDKQMQIIRDIVDEISRYVVPLRVRPSVSRNPPGSGSSRKNRYGKGANMNKNLLILGEGQYGAVAKETAEAMSFFDNIAFLDDENKVAVGQLDEYESFVTEYSYAVQRKSRASIA